MKTLEKVDMKFHQKKITKKKANNQTESKSCKIDKGRESNILSQSQVEIDFTYTTMSPSQIDQSSFCTYIESLQTYGVT